MLTAAALMTGTQALLALVAAMPVMLIMLSLLACCKQPTVSVTIYVSSADYM